VRYLENFTVGDTATFGRYEVTEDEIIEFAARYDPQAFHVDPDKGREQGWDGVIASGWHTCAMFMRMLVDNVMGEGNGMPSPGIEEVRWLRPVRPGYVLSVRSEVVEVRASRSKPDRGIVRTRFEVLDQTGEPVMSMINTGFMPRREATSAD
jgi:acyl dehydratase